jgi:F-type H+-transporting ATPase subunit a
MHTWIALGVIGILCIVASLLFRHTELSDRHESPLLQPPVFTATSYGKFLATLIIKSFITFIEQSAGTLVYRYFSFIASLFIFILICNWIAIFPGVGEPTKDLSTTLALGTIALLYIQKETIKVHGFIAYIKDYFLPISIFFPLNIIIGLFHAPIKLLGELAILISLSFRLFGNIFGGAIIIELLHKGIAGSWILQSMSVGVNLLLIGFFVIFEGGLQAFVFSILTLTNICMATAVEEGKH